MANLFNRADTKNYEKKNIQYYIAIDKMIKDIAAKNGGDPDFLEEITDMKNILMDNFSDLETISWDIEVKHKNYVNAYGDKFDESNNYLRGLDKNKLKEECRNIRQFMFQINKRITETNKLAKKNIDKIAKLKDVMEIAYEINNINNYVETVKDDLQQMVQLYEELDNIINKGEVLDNKLERGINQCNKFIKQIGAEDLNILGENGNECFLRLNKNKKILNSDIDKAKNLKDKLIKGGKIDKSRVLEVCHANYSIDQIFNEDYVLSHLVKIHDAYKIKSEASSFIPTTYSQAFGYNQVYDFVDSHEPIAGQSYGQNQNAYVPRNFNPIFNGNHN